MFGEIQKGWITGNLQAFEAGAHDCQNLASKYCRFLKLKGNCLNQDGPLAKQPLEYIKQVIIMKEDNKKLDFFQFWKWPHDWKGERLRL